MVTLRLPVVGINGFFGIGLHNFNLTKISKIVLANTLTTGGDDWWEETRTRERAGHVAGRSVGMRLEKSAKNRSKVKEGMRIDLTGDRSN